MHVCTHIVHITMWVAACACTHCWLEECLFAQPYKCTNT